MRLAHVLQCDHRGASVWLVALMFIGATAADLRACAAAPPESPVVGFQEDPPAAPPQEEKPKEAATPELDEAIEKAEESGPPAAIREKGPFEVHGWLSLSYRGRKEGGDNDEDLYGYLSLDGGRPESDDLSFHLFARATYDLDGDADAGTNPFFSLNDVDGNEFDGHLYEAFIDLRRSLAPEFLGIEKVRIGRQSVHLEYSYLLDGIRLDFARIRSFANLGISVYGGVPEFLYESSRRTDWIAGVDISLRPLERTRIELRYAHIQDSADWTDGQERDDYAAVSIRQGIGEEAALTAEWATIDAATRDVTLRFSWDISDIDLSIFASWRYQNDVEHEYTTELDPYFGVLGPSYAYHQADLQVSKLFGNHFGADAGFTGRLLEDDDLEGPFNREFARGWLTLSSFNWPVQNLDLSVTGELWESDDDETATAGIEATWRATPDLRFSAGAFYSLFKYDLFVLDEREHATTLFARVRWKFAEGFRADGRYEFETGDEGEFHTVWLGLTWSF